MRFLVSMFFAGILACSSHALAEGFLGKDAETILMKGKVVADGWNTEMGIHHTRVIYKDTYYMCVSGKKSITTQIQSDTTKMLVQCFDRK